MSLFSEEMRRDPFPTYDAMRARSPVHVPIGDRWMILDYDGVKRALSDHEYFSSNVSPSRGLAFEWLLFMDPPRHTQLRAIVTKAFTPRSVAALEPRIRALTLGLLEPLVERGEMDVAADFAVPLPMMVIAEMLGLPADDWRRLEAWSAAIINLGATIAGTPDESRRASERFLAANAEMEGYLAALVAERRASPRDDLITRLIEAEVDGERLGDKEVLRFFELLLAAGTETTTNLIDNAIVCFLDRPDELERLQAQRSLLPSAIEEVLRYRSPAQTMFRATSRDVELGGQTIPAGKFVLVRVALGEWLPRIGAIAHAGDERWQPRAAFQVHGPASLPIRFERR